MSSNPFQPKDINNYPACFIAMPITTKSEDAERFNDKNHWEFIQNNLIKPAIHNSNFRPIEPTVTGSDLIHSHIFDNIVTSPLAVIDISSHNPNVFLELGIRISANMPMVLIHNGVDKIPFDIGLINIHKYPEYLSRNNQENLDREIEKLSQSINETWERDKESNILWKNLGIENDVYSRIIRNSHNNVLLKARKEILYGMAQRLKGESYGEITDYKIIDTPSDHYIVIFTPRTKLDTKRQEYLKAGFGYYINVTVLFDYSNLI